MKRNVVVRALALAQSETKLSFVRLEICIRTRGSLRVLRNPAFGSLGRLAEDLLCSTTSFSLKWSFHSHAKWIFSKYHSFPHPEAAHVISPQFDWRRAMRISHRFQAYILLSSFIFVSHSTHLTAQSDSTAPKPAAQSGADKRDG